MDLDKLPSKPVVPSLASADRDLREWMKENDFHLVKDIDGMIWHLDVSAHQRPAPDEVKRPIWDVRVEIHTEVSAPDLLAASVLSEDTDARFIQLIAGHRIPLHMKPMVHRAYTFEEARQWLGEAILHCRQRFQDPSLTAIKRTLIGRWIDQRSCFGDRKTP